MTAATEQREKTGSDTLWRHACRGLADHPCIGVDGSEDTVRIVDVVLRHAIRPDRCAEPRIRVLHADTMVVHLA